jgi:hypothetical protein
MRFAESGGPGMAEEATGLPINMRQVRCPVAFGSQSMNLFGIASIFYEDHCIGCSLRRPTGEVLNLATVMEERAAEDARQAALQRPLSSARLAFSQDRLRDARAELDSALSPDGVPTISAKVRDLPADAAEWFSTWLVQTQARLADVLAVYTVAGEVPGLLAATVREGQVNPLLDPRLPRYVTLPNPSGVLLGRVTLTALNGRPKRLFHAILLTHSPVLWLGSGPRAQALYRMPGALAAVLLAGTGVFTDAGPVQESDTDQVLRVAAALFDGVHAGAPLADPCRALTPARDLVAA